MKRKSYRMKETLKKAGCFLSIDDKNAGIYRSTCLYDGRTAYGTLEELIDLYGLR